MVFNIGWFTSVSLRLVWFGFFNARTLRRRVYSKTPITDIHGRTFGVWTLLTSTLCFLCAFYPEDKPLYIATFPSFLYALGHFMIECLIYRTMIIRDISSVNFLCRHIDDMDVAAIECPSS